MSASAGVAGDTMVPTMYRVVGRRRETHDTVTVRLVASSVALDDPAPGQFMMVWAPGVGEIPVSVAGVQRIGGTRPGSELLFTVRDVGAASGAIAGLEDGSPVGLRGPFGHGWTLPEPDEPAIVVAGGLGLAPLRMLVETLLATTRSAPFDLVVGARNPSEIIYSDLLHRWVDDCDVAVTVDRGGPGWQGQVGLVTAELARLDLSADARAWVCGPEIMMRFVARDLVEAGVDPNSVEVSLERSMACAVGHCGRCQLGPVLVCRDGAVLPWTTAEPLMEVRRW